MSRKVFTAGEVLAAADVNSFLMDQTVMSFAGTAARGSAIPSPVNGMVTYLEDSDSVQIFDGSSFAEAVSTNAWTAYTPTITVGSGALTSFTTTGAYKLVGKVCHVRVFINITNNGTAGTNIRASMPFAMVNNLYVGVHRENNVTGNLGAFFATIVGGTALGVFTTTSNLYPGGTSYGLHGSLAYEVA
jgi:hypothetical protein